MAKEASNVERTVVGLERQTSSKLKKLKKNGREYLLANDSNLCQARSAVPKLGTGGTSVTSCAKPWELETVTQEGTEIDKIHAETGWKNSRPKVQSLQCDDARDTQSQSITCNVPANETSTGGNHQALLPLRNKNPNPQEFQGAVDEYGYVISHPGTIKDPRISPRTMPIRMHEAPETMSLYEANKSLGLTHVSPKPMSGNTQVEVEWMSLDQTAVTSEITDETTLTIKHTDDEEGDWILVSESITSFELVDNVKDCFVIL